jgi:anti-sigma factor RsiW
MLQMPCEMAHLIEAYLDGEGDESERQRVEAHLAGCAMCAGMLENLRQLRRRLSAWSALERAPAQERAFWLQLAQKLPLRAAAAPRSLWVPAALALSQILLDAMALLTLALSVGMLLGGFSGVDSWLRQTLSFMPAVSALDAARLTWPGSLGTLALGLTGSAGVEALSVADEVLSWVLPVFVFTALSGAVFLAMTGWAGLQWLRRPSAR